MRSLPFAASNPIRVPGDDKVEFVEGEHASANEIHELNTAVKGCTPYRVPVPAG